MSTKYVGLALAALVVIIITLDVAVPTINNSLNAKVAVNGLDVLNPVIPYDTPIQLSHKPIQGTVKVYNATYTAVEGSDYTVDYMNGTITILSTGALLNTSSYNVSYQYYVPVYTGTNATLLKMTVLMLVLGVLIMIATTMVMRWL